MPAGPSTVRAFVTRTSRGSRLKACGEFQKAQCQPSQSLCDRASDVPEPADGLRVGLEPLPNGRPRDDLDLRPGLVQQRRGLQRGLAAAHDRDPCGP